MESPVVTGITNIDIISVVIASLALVLSLASWIRVIMKERFKIKVQCIGYSYGKSDTNASFTSYTFCFIVHNLSNSPVSISTIHVKMQDGTWSDFRLTKRFFKEHLYPFDSSKTYPFFTSEFPINILGNTSQLIIAGFTNTNDNHVCFDMYDNVSFSFETNHGSRLMSLTCNKVDLLSI